MKTSLFRLWGLGIVLAAAAAFWPATAAAQEPTEEQLRRLYADTREQLRIAQERKNELAQQNERLVEENAKLKRAVEEKTVEAAVLKSSLVRWQMLAIEASRQMAMLGELARLNAAVRTAVAMMPGLRPGRGAFGMAEEAGPVDPLTASASWPHVLPGSGRLHHD